MVAAICVIFIHASQFIYDSGKATILNYYLLRRFSDLGVIFFFATTGYFLAQNRSTAKIYRSIKILFKAWIVATISYFILFLSIDLLKYIFFGDSFINSVKDLLETVNITNLITGRMFIGITWYLPASIVSLYIFSLFNKYKISNSNIIIISFSIWVVTYFKVLDFNSLVPFGGFPKAILCMALGHFTYESSYRIRWSLFFAVVFGIAGAYASLKIYSMLLPLQMITVYLALNYCKFNPGKKTWFSIISKNSLSVYLYHYVVLLFSDFIFRYFSISKLEFKSLYIISVILGSFIMAPHLFKLCNKTLRRLGTFLVLEK